MRLNFFLCLAMAALPGFAARAGETDDLAAFERAAEAGDLHQAGDAAKRLRLARQRPGETRSDPLLNGLYGRLMLHGGHASEAIAYLERSEGPDVPPAQRTAATLALAEALEDVGDPESALAALARLGAGPVEPRLRQAAALAAARLRLPSDPQAALAEVRRVPEGSWQAELIASQAHSLAGDAAAARAAADRAWIAAAAAPAGESAPLRAALLRAGLAAAGSDREALLAMLNAAGSAVARLDARAADYLPVCGERGITAADRVILAAWQGPIGREGLMPVAASRSAAVAPFLDALAGRPLLEGDSASPRGLVFAARCRSHVSANYDIPPRRPDPWAKWLAARGLYFEPPGRGDLDDINRLSSEIESLARAHGDDHPPLIPMRVQLSAWLMGRAAQAGDVQAWQVEELRRKVATAIRKLGGAESLVPSDEQFAEQQAIATAGSFDRFLVLMRAAGERRVSSLPLDAAYAEVRQWFDSDADLPVATRIRILQKLLARFDPSAADPRRNAILTRLGLFQRSAGNETAARAAHRSAGLPDAACFALAEIPAVTEQPIDDGAYPIDALKFNFEGVTTLELEIGSDGRIAGHRIILASPAGIFETVVAEKIPDFRLTIPKSGGRPRACGGYVQNIRWRMPPETETGLPRFLPPDSSGT